MRIFRTLIQVTISVRVSNNSLLFARNPHIISLFIKFVALDVSIRTLNVGISLLGRDFCFLNFVVVNENLELVKIVVIRNGVFFRYAH